MPRCIKKRLACLLTAAFVFLLGASASFALPRLPTKPLTEGDQSSSVTALQEGLQNLGFFNAVPDGAYGEGTAAAVRQLQRMMGIQASGQYDKETIDAYAAAVKNESMSLGILSTDLAAIESEATQALKNALSGRVIGIDAGHQKTPDRELEAIAPGSDRTKERMSAGCVGAKTGIEEYEITLQISNKLKKLLENAGASVVMSRSKNDVSLSNVERAKIMNEMGVDCWIRIHCNHSNDRNKSGISVLIPSHLANPAVAQNSALLAKLVLSATTEETGAAALDVTATDEQTGFNWSSSPVIAVELGFLSNPVEDVRLNRDSYQQSCAAGICAGLVNYFLPAE